MTSNPLIPCHVQVRTANGIRHEYAGMYKSTIDAAKDALARFGIAKVKVTGAVK